MWRNRPCRVGVLMLVMLEPRRSGAAWIGCGACQGGQVGSSVTKHLDSCVEGLLQAGLAWGCTADQ